MDAVEKVAKATKSTWVVWSGHTVHSYVEAWMWFLAGEFSACEYVQLLQSAIYLCVFSLQKSVCQSFWSLHKFWNGIIC